MGCGGKEVSRRPSETFYHLREICDVFELHFLSRSLWRLKSVDIDWKMLLKHDCMFRFTKSDAELQQRLSLEVKMLQVWCIVNVFEQKKKKKNSNYVVSQTTNDCLHILDDYSNQTFGSIQWFIWTEEICRVTTQTSPHDIDSSSVLSRAHFPVRICVPEMFFCAARNWS